jgi:hypothetical protein
MASSTSRPRARDGFGVETKTEISPARDRIDVGELFHHKKGFIEAGFAYEYWFNKFGNDSDLMTGAIANTPMFVGRVHF